MSTYRYNKISTISFSSSSSGMMLGSNHSLNVEIRWEDDGTVILTRTEIKGFEKEESTWTVESDMAEKIRYEAERVDMASWGTMKYEEDPTMRCTDYSSSASGSIILDMRDLGGKPYEIITFNQIGVSQAGKGEDLNRIETLLSAVQDPEKRTGYKKTDTRTSGGSGAGNMFMGFSMMMPNSGQ